MEPDRLYLILSTLAFAAGLVHAIQELRARRWLEGRWHWLPLAVGFAFQTAYIYVRSREVGGCLLTQGSPAGWFVFIAWSLVLLYFLVGSSHRLSVLGVFTAPLVMALHAIALTWPEPKTAAAVKSGNPWPEIHVGLTMIAYAAFALGCISGIVYLTQERLLKRRRIAGIFYQLPPLPAAAKSIFRLTWLGCLILSLAMLATLWIPAAATDHLVMGWMIWGFYMLLGIVMWRHAFSPKRLAWFAAVGFLIPMVSLWLLTGK
jgi:HemX protein